MLRLSQKEIAEVLGVTARTIRDWAAEGLPRLDDQSYPAADCVAWLVARNRAADGDLNPEQERARKDKEAADKLAMDNAVRRGELLDGNLLGEDLARWLTAFRQAMLRAPTKLAPLVNPEKPTFARDLIAEEHSRILAELAEHFSGTAPTERGLDDGDAGDAATSTANANGVAVGGSISTAQRRNKRRARPV